jgi:deoxycytidylate deaminase
MTQASIDKFFDLARNASMFSDFPKCRIGAVIVYKNKVVSVGWNAEKTNPLQKEYNRLRGFDTESANNSLHAEMMCICKGRKADIDWGKASIFVYREYKNGGLAMSRPCPACFQAIKDIGIKNIYYTGNGSYIYERIQE